MGPGGPARGALALDAAGADAVCASNGPVANSKAASAAIDTVVLMAVPFDEDARNIHDRPAATAPD
jgi:hypothetical protein